MRTATLLHTSSRLFVKALDFFGQLRADLQQRIPDVLEV
jgi:hypothetical protein